MTEKEIQDILDELNDVRPEVLNDKAKRLFEAIMQIANERDELRRKNEELKADNYEANNIIKDLLDNIPVQKVKDKIEELKNNIDYLKQFNDWNEKDYTNEDIINNVLEVLQKLLEGGVTNEL